MYSNIEILKNKYTNLTFIEILEEKIITLKNYFGLNANETIYLLIMDFPSKDPMTATSYYDYKLLLENGTELNLSIIQNELLYFLEIYLHPMFQILGWNVILMKERMFHDRNASK